MLKTQGIILTILAFVLFLLGCSGSETPDNPTQDLEVVPNSGVYLVYGNQGILESDRRAIEQVARETILLVNNTMPVKDFTIEISADASQAIPEIGIGGFNPSESEVLIFVDPNFSNLDQSIAVELGPMLAHEIHHVNRRRAVGYGSTLLEAIVSEGLADSFAIEITGIEPPLWSVAVTGGELENWLDLAKDTWMDSFYDHPKWFFGTTEEVPRWTGYSMGYKLVGDYLMQHPNKKPSTLFNEPANSFIQ